MLRSRVRPYKTLQDKQRALHARGGYAAAAIRRAKSKASLKQTRLEARQQARKQKATVRIKTALDQAFTDGYLTSSWQHCNEKLDASYYQMCVQLNRPYAVLYEKGKRADVLLDFISCRDGQELTEVDVIDGYGEVHPSGVAEAERLIKEVGPRARGWVVDSMFVQVFNIPADRAPELIRGLLRSPTRSFGSHELAARFHEVEAAERGAAHKGLMAAAHSLGEKR